MKHRASRRFWQCFNALPEHVRQQANESFAKLKSDPHHPSLHFKKVGRFWSARVGMSHRAVAVEFESDLIWFWIGNHDEYERLIR